MKREIDLPTRGQTKSRGGNSVVEEGSQGVYLIYDVIRLGAILVTAEEVSKMIVDVTLIDP